MIIITEYKCRQGGAALPFYDKMDEQVYIDEINRLQDELERLRKDYTRLLTLSKKYRKQTETKL